MKTRKCFLAVMAVCVLFFSGITLVGASAESLSVDEIMDKMEETAPDFSTQKNYG